MKQTLAVFLAVLSFTVSSFQAYAQESAKTAGVDRLNKAAPPAPARREVTTDVVKQDMAEALSVIENNYVGGKSLNYNDVVKVSIDSMLHTLDPHSNYFDPKEFEAFKTEQSSRYYGIGATIGDLSDENGKVIATYIKATFEGAPANVGGLRYGDKIVEVNGTSMLGKNFSEVRTFLRGPRGTPAKIVVERADTGKRETVEIIRDAVSQPSISEAYMIRPGVGYINLNGGFNQTTFDEFVGNMRLLKAEGMQQLILDLRNNGGGLVNQARRVANAFLSAGQTIMTQKGRIQGVNETLVADNKNPDRSPLVVLVNRNTASASEILAGALQDHDRALIVGENTFGKGLVQNPFVFADNDSMLLLTIAKYQTPSGRLIQRDYSNGDLYNYYTEGGSLRDESDSEDNKPKGVASKTDTGRDVYSGGGINPDVPVKQRTITIERGRLQQKIANPVFSFALDLVTGRVPGYESYKVDKSITFDHDVKPADFPIPPALYAKFRDYAGKKYRLTPAQVDSEKEFVERMLRSELITAAYGSQSSFQVFNEYDDQLLKAIESLPQAHQLELQSERAKLGLNKQRTPIN